MARLNKDPPHTLMQQTTICKELAYTQNQFLFMFKDMQTGFRHTDQTNRKQAQVIGTKLVDTDKTLDKINL